MICEILIAHKEFSLMFFIMDKAIEDRLKDALSTYLGYPCTSSYDYSAVVRYLNYNINNVGDPNILGTYRANTKDVECEVLRFFASLWDISQENIWAYVTNSGTEGNLQGLFIARESAGNKPHVFLCSGDCHYSIFKIARILKLEIQVVASQENGEIDYHDFERHVVENKDKYIIVNANLGTTMKGAIDNTREIYRIIKKHLVQSYIHVDGALTGFYLPFLEKDLFFKAHVNSMSISGHKFMGIPFPCGVFMMDKNLCNLVSHDIEYIGSKDCMISGSRNGHSPLFMKHIIDQKGYDGFRKDVEMCIEQADWLCNQIDGAWRNHNSITVVIPRPRTEIISKWQLATEGNISHVVVMPHVTREKLIAFLCDLKD